MKPYLDNPPPGPHHEPDKKMTETIKTLVEENRQKQVNLKPSRHAAIVTIGPQLSNVDAATDCSCGCHPKPANPYLHNGGQTCTCQRTEEEKRENFQKVLTHLWEAREDNNVEHEYEKKVFHAAKTQGATIRNYLPATPFVIAGFVDGYSFYLRERHDVWRLVVAGDDDPTADVWNDNPPGALVIAEGSTATWDWTNTQMVTDAIKEVKRHIRSQQCQHPNARTYCPDCGTKTDNTP